MNKLQRQLWAWGDELENMAEELVMNRVEEVEPHSSVGRHLIASAQMDADDLNVIAALIKRGKFERAKQEIRNLDTVARARIPEDIMDALFPTGRLEEDFKKTIAMVENKKMKVSLAELKAMIKEALKKQEQASVQETSREAERNYHRAQAKLDREQPIPVNSSWENDSFGNTTLFLSLEETLRSYNIAEVGTDRSRQNVFIRFSPKGKSK